MQTLSLPNRLKYVRFEQEWSELVGRQILGFC
jgi:hypothetical protein